jgi:hypothetical protein
LFADRLGFIGADGIIWEEYIVTLITIHVKIKDDEDELIWSMHPIRIMYTPKLGYKVLK